MLSETVIRESWEAERESMRDFLLNEKKFNPKTVDNFIDKFIASMVFAGLPCRSQKGISAAWRRFKVESA